MIIATPIIQSMPIWNIKHEQTQDSGTAARDAEVSLC
jgi:hypothetical protein